jgi:hypothetical protein
MPNIGVGFVAMFAKEAVKTTYFSASSIFGSLSPEEEEEEEDDNDED